MSKVLIQLVPELTLSQRQAIWFQQVQIARALNAARAARVSK